MPVDSQAEKRYNTGSLLDGCMIGRVPQTMAGGKAVPVGMHVMRRFLAAVALAAAISPVAAARVWTTVYRCDGLTPLAVVDPNRLGVYPDIMVGTRLAILVSSDTGEPWSGAMVISRDQWGRGTLSGRGFNKKQFSYMGSCLEAAGEMPVAMDVADSTKEGLWFGTYFSSRPLPGERIAAPGAWFVVDYHAWQEGECRVELKDDGFNLLETLTFYHVPSWDFNGDATVNLVDFAMLSSYWGSALDPESERTFDRNADGRIGISEIAMFSEHWLEATDCAEAGAEPNGSAESPAASGDPQP